MLFPWECRVPVFEKFATVVRVLTWRQTWPKLFRWASPTYPEWAVKIIACIFSKSKKEKKKIITCTPKTQRRGRRVFLFGASAPVCKGAPEGRVKMGSAHSSFFLFFAKVKKTCGGKGIRTCNASVASTSFKPPGHHNADLNLLHFFFFYYFVLHFGLFCFFYLFLFSHSFCFL